MSATAPGRRRPDMDRELLLEIGCEGLPASWLPGLTNQLGEVVITQLKEHRLAPEAPAETYSTPRRLTVRIGRLAERQTDLEEVLNGPPVSAAFLSTATSSRRASVRSDFEALPLQPAARTRAKSTLRMP